MGDLAFERAAAQAAAEEAEELFGPDDADEASPGEELLELEDAEQAPAPTRRASRVVDLMEDTPIDFDQVNPKRP
eukprot:551171-Heterocapsa_arctica.AAC.1